MIRIKLNEVLKIGSLQHFRMLLIWRHLREHGETSQFDDFWRVGWKSLLGSVMKTKIIVIFNHTGWQLYTEKCASNDCQWVFHRVRLHIECRKFLIERFEVSTLPHCKYFTLEINQWSNFSWKIDWEGSSSSVDLQLHRISG